MYIIPTLLLTGWNLVKRMRARGSEKQPVDLIAAAAATTAWQRTGVKKVTEIESQHLHCMPTPLSHPKNSGGNRDKQRKVHENYIFLSFPSFSSSNLLHPICPYTPYTWQQARLNCAPTRQAGSIDGGTLKEAIASYSSRTAAAADITKCVLASMSLYRWL